MIYIKLLLENTLEIIFEFGRHFWPKRDFRAIFWDFDIMKSDKSKNFSGYGLYEYIDEEKFWKKNNWLAITQELRHLE